MNKRYFLIGILTIVVMISFSKRSFAQLPIIGKSFFALTVKNADSTAKWYSTTFHLKTLNAINDSASGAIIRILGNDNMVIEILQLRDTKDVTGVGLNTVFQLHGLVKVGFFVRSLDEVQKHFDQKGVKIKYGPFNDEGTKTKNLIINDSEGNLIQFFEDVK